MRFATTRVPMLGPDRAAFSPMCGPTTAAIGSDPQVGRLIDALEAERSHIARELHDDIGQSLAVLVMQMWQAGKANPGIAALCSQVQSIAARVSRLSHELHSSSLEFRGLEKTIGRVCGAFSEAHRTPVSFACQDIPPDLDNRVALCLLRVVQEALQNVAKHSRATRVDVTLTGAHGNEITLAVVDDGMGFDASQASLAEGVGLISMRERLRFVGGTFTISSAPGDGTRIEARVPVRPKAG